MVFGIDGSKALARAIRDVYGKLGVIQRCQEHKRRNAPRPFPESIQSRLQIPHVSICMLCGLSRMLVSQVVSTRTGGRHDSA